MSDQSIPLDDPRLTAYALGELSPAESAAIDQLVAGSPSHRVAVEEIRSLAGLLTSELLQEPALPLTESQRMAIARGAMQPAVQPAAPVIAAPPRRWVGRLASLATIAGMIVVAVLVVPRNRPAPTSSPHAYYLNDKSEDVSRNWAFDRNGPTHVEGASPSGFTLAAPANSTSDKNRIESGGARDHILGGIVAGANADNRGIEQRRALGITKSGTTVLSADASLKRQYSTATQRTRVSAERLNEVPKTVPNQVHSHHYAPDSSSERLPVLHERLKLEGQSWSDAADVYAVRNRPVSSEGKLANGAVTQPTDGIVPHLNLDVANGSIASSTRRVADDSPAEGATRLHFGVSVENTEAYDPIIENPFVAPTAEPLSTFGVDVDTASYANVRRFLTNQQMPPRNAVRIEELVNYFRYDYPQPAAGQPVSINVEVGRAPWRPGNRLVRIGLKGREIPRDKRPTSNFVFLVDVSGSMQAENKLPLVKAGLSMLTEQMTESDRVAIVTYSDTAALRLESTTGDNRQPILNTITGLQANGSTNGAGGIQLAYETAVRHFIEGGVNRVILCTDGDFNVGVTGDDELVKLIEERARSKVFFSVFGFGMGNLKDGKLEKLADKGNGHYAYIDGQREAKKVFVDELSGTLVTIAKDVKLQVEFNPARVGAYRLIGYENRALAAQDFNNDKKDAGDMGAGHTVTALYEIVPADTLPRQSAEERL
ncbi:MAG TPA: von Willebrand factor type A domain-containing protein, partial [Planctomycetaceae bacterium]|nr:von Willebrand factor type A domain-containing protein [Planctomycetaceae bacterium]